MNPRAKYQKEWQTKNKKHLANYQREYHKKRKGTQAGKKNEYSRQMYMLRKRYNITPEARAIMFQAQEGCCAICEEHESNLKRKLAIDHCHETGLVRGLLCSQCNLRLKGFELDWYRYNALKYLKGYGSI